MLGSRLHRTAAAVFALAALAFTASGAPDDKGTDAAFGWWSFVALGLLFVPSRAPRPCGQSATEPTGPTPPCGSGLRPINVQRQRGKDKWQRKEQ